MTESPIKIHQLLHGYNDGHRQLASSLNLPPSVRQALLASSDVAATLPNDKAQRFTSSVLTGYALQGVRAYVLARTWPAFEMPRPGSVWTHSLIIDEDDLVRLRDLDVMYRAFRRPDPVKMNLDAYSTALLIDPVPRAQGSSVERVDAAASAAVLWGLYGHRDANPGVLYGLPMPNEAAERLVVRVWTQQWPQLRRMFAFQVGNWSKMSIYAELNLMWQTSRRVPNGIGSAPDPAEPWLALAADDLQATSPTALRTFLNRTAEDIAEPWTAFADLVRVYAAMGEVREGKQSLLRVAHTVASRFPSPTAAGALKQAVVGPDDAAPPAERQRLEVLLDEVVASAFPLDALQIYERSCALWAVDEETALGLTFTALSAVTHPTAQEIMKAAATSAPESALNALLQREPGAIYGLVAAHPQLAESPAVWRRVATKPQELFDMLRSLDETLAPQWPLVVRSVLDAGAHGVAAQALAFLGEEAVEGVLTWLAEQPAGASVPPEWYRALAPYKEVLLASAGRSESPALNVVALLTTILDPWSIGVREANPDMWTTLAEHLNVVDPSRRTEVATFLLTLGSGLTTPTGYQLIEATFEEVYECAKHDGVPYLPWTALQKSLPNLGFGNWDKCERLRRGLAHWYATNDWPEDSLLRAMRSPKPFRKIVKYGLKDKATSAYFKRLWNLVRTHQVDATPAQVAALPD